MLIMKDNPFFSAIMIWLKKEQPKFLSYDTLNFKNVSAATKIP